MPGAPTRRPDRRPRAALRPLAGAIALTGALLAGACAPAMVPAGPPARAAEVQEDALVMPDGARLPLRRFSPEGPPRGVILALHGFNDYSRAFRRPAPWFTGRGWILYAYDQRGFGQAGNRGLWAGADTLAQDARTAARLIRARHPGLPLVLLGESMGGAVLMLATTEGEGAPHDALVLVAPAVRGFSALSWLERNALWFMAHALGPLGVYGSTPTVRASDNDEALRELGRDPRVLKTTRMDTLWGLVSLMERALDAAGRMRGDTPTLVLFGERDRLVPPEVAAAMLARLPEEGDAARRIAVYPRGYHLLLRDRFGRNVTEDVLAFIESGGRALPSEAEERGRAALLAARNGAVAVAERPDQGAELAAQRTTGPAPDAAAASAGQATRALAR
ncbi:MAG: lysophospholipase [Alphaproteobacteria bacterium]|nr:lysophospholipase [Alphaproteobacteria bacterium]